MHTFDIGYKAPVEDKNLSALDFTIEFRPEKF